MTFFTDNQDWMPKYLREVADAMGLTHWHVAFIELPPERDSNASTWLSNSYEKLAVGFADRWEVGSPLEADWTPATLRQITAHELMHAYLRDLSRTFESLQDIASAASWGFASDRWTHELEKVVDALAEWMAPYLPLPDADQIIQSVVTGTPRERSTNVRVIDSAHSGEAAPHPGGLPGTSDQDD